mgnify:CR=1 FL=1
MPQVTSPNWVGGFCMTHQGQLDGSDHCPRCLREQHPEVRVALSYDEAIKVGSGELTVAKILPPEYAWLQARIKRR